MTLTALATMLMPSTSFCRLFSLSRTFLAIIVVAAAPRWEATERTPALTSAVCVMIKWG